MPKLKFFPTVLNTLHCTEVIPLHVLMLSLRMYWYYPPACTDIIPSLYWTTSTVMKLSLHRNEAIPTVLMLSPGQTIPTFHATTCNICCEEKVCTVWPPCCVLLYHVACCCIMLHVVVSCCMLLYHVAWSLLAIKNVCRTNVVRQNISFVFSDVACCCFRLTTFPNVVVFAPAQWDSDFPQLSTSWQCAFNPLFTFNSYLSGFKNSSVKQNRLFLYYCFRSSVFWHIENSDSVVIDLQKLKDVLQNDTKYYISENIK